MARNLFCSINEILFRVNMGPQRYALIKCQKVTSWRYLVTIRHLLAQNAPDLNICCFSLTYHISSSEMYDDSAQTPI